MTLPTLRRRSLHLMGLLGLGLLGLAGLGASLSGCRRTTPSEAAESIGAPSRVEQPLASAAGSGSPSAAPVAVASTSAQAEPTLPWRFPAAPRLAAFGDLHGDYGATRAALRLAGAIDANDHWAGGKLVLVQTGDILDRGDEERAILDLLKRLEEEAPSQGGKVVLVNGNHELMNVLGDFRYVSAMGFVAFAEVPPEGRTGNAALRFPARVRGRAHAFLPGGRYAKQFAERNIVAMVGDTLFVHGGVLPEHVERGLGTLNQEMQRFVRGSLAEAPASVSGEDSPVWVRRYSEGDPDPAACKLLGTALEKAGAKRMVVGHTPQKNGITSGCEERVWRIDTGMSRSYGGKPAVLEIVGDKVRILR